MRHLDFSCRYETGPAILTRPYFIKLLKDRAADSPGESRQVSTLTAIHSRHSTHGHDSAVEFLHRGGDRISLLHL